MSVDPIGNSFPYYTPYQFAGNKPIVAIDLDGLEDFIIHSKTESDAFMNALCDLNDASDVLHQIQFFRAADSNINGPKYPKVASDEFGYEGGNVISRVDNPDAFTVSGFTKYNEQMYQWKISFDKKVENLEPEIAIRTVTYSPKGGSVVFGDGTSGYDLDLSWPSTNEKGNYDAIDWGTSMPGGGGADWRGSGFLTGMKMVTGLIKRYLEIESTLDGDNEDLGSGASIPDESTSSNPTNLELDSTVWESSKDPQYIFNNTEDKGKNYYDNGSTQDTTRSRTRTDDKSRTDYKRYGWESKKDN